MKNESPVTNEVPAEATIGPLGDGRLTRRRFLTIGAGTAVAVALVACTTGKSASGGQRAASAGTPIAATPIVAPELQRFLALSAVLSGVPVGSLDAAAGQKYLAALQTPPKGGLPLTQIEDALGVRPGAAVPSFAQATAGGALNQPAARATADAVAEYWYRGQIPVPSGSAGGAGSQPVEVTYIDALGWQALHFAKAPTNCGGTFGFWSAAPAT